MKKILISLIAALTLSGTALAQPQGVEPSADVLQPAPQSNPATGTRDAKFQIQSQEPLQPAGNREQMLQYLQLDTGVTGEASETPPETKPTWPWLLGAVMAVGLVLLLIGELRKPAVVKSEPPKQKPQDQQSQNRAKKRKKSKKRR